MGQVGEHRWTEVLRCPACAGSFTLDRVPTPALGRGLWGTLTCGCSTYPVVDDIPILLADRVRVNTTGVNAVLDEGVPVADVVAAVRGGDPAEALVALLQTPPVPWPLGRLGPVRAALARPAIGAAVDRAGAARTRRLLAHRDRVALEEVLAQRYLHSLDIGQDYAYFLLRASQPRQLAFLALLETVPPGLVLDIGCGLGHHSWALGLTGHDVIGVDYNFAELWMARWWVATSAAFVCADVTRPLPFPDGLGDSAWFADSIDLVPDPAATAAEMVRCARPGPVYLARVGVESRGFYTTARPVEAWVECFGHLGPLRLSDEQRLIEGYLDGWQADLSADDPAEDLRTAENVFVTISDDPAVLRDHGPLPEPPPHARGRLVVNPIYAPVGGDPRRLRLRLPADWFAFEDGDLTRYHDHQAVLTDEDVAALRRDELTPALRDLVDRFVVVGLPERYTARQRRRLKLRLYEVSTALLPRLVDVPDGTRRPPGRRPLGHRTRRRG